MCLNPLSKFVALPAANKLLLVRAFVHLLAASFTVRVLSYRQLKAGMERIRLESPNPISARDIKWSIEALSRRIPGAHCLVQSVAGYALFRKYGYEVEFCVGVAKPEGKFAAHAWLEHDGQIIIGGADSESRFTQLGVSKP